MTDNRKLSDFRPLERNPNRHTQRGLRSLEASVGEDGWVAPITVAADGEGLDGSARLEVAFDKFDEDVLVIEHDGTKPVVMVRSDIPHTETARARRIIYRANRVAELNLDYDLALLMEDAEVLPDEAWTLGELELVQLLAQAEDFLGSDDELFQSVSSDLGKKAKYIKVVLSVEDLMDFEKAVLSTGLPNRGEAVAEVCRSYLGNHEQKEG